VLMALAKLLDLLAMPLPVKAIGEIQKITDVIVMCIT
jgi:hypothetical protein